MLVGFGSFAPKSLPAREGRNPRTGEKLQIAASRVPAFSVAKTFKERVNASKDAPPGSAAAAAPSGLGSGSSAAPASSA